MKATDIKRNGSGYYDETAYKAITNIMKRKENKMDIYKGDIFRAELNNGTEREFVILSVHSNFSTVLMLSDKESLPYSVNCNGIMYTHPGMIQYMFNEKFTTFIRSMKEDEIDDLMDQVVGYLGCSVPSKDEQVVEKVVEKIVEVPTANNSKMELEYAKAITERDVYKNLYENLIRSMIVGKEGTAR